MILGEIFVENSAEMWITIHNMIVKKGILRIGIKFEMIRDFPDYKSFKGLL